jgi:hypothetical protein
VIAPAVLDPVGSVGGSRVVAPGAGVDSGHG